MNNNEISDTNEVEFHAENSGVEEVKEEISNGLE